MKNMSIPAVMATPAQVTNNWGQNLWFSNLVTHQNHLRTNYRSQKITSSHRHTKITTCFPGGTVVKNLPANAGETSDVGSIPGLGRTPGEGNGNLLHCSCLGNSTDRGSWRVQSTGHRVGPDWACVHTHTTHTEVLWTERLNTWTHTHNPTVDQRPTEGTHTHTTLLWIKETEGTSQPFLQLKIKRNKHNQRCGGAKTQYSQDPYLGVSDPQTELKLQRGSPQGTMGSLTSASPNRRVLCQEGEPPEHLALKVSGAYLWESQRAGGNRDFTLKGCTHKLMLQGTSINLKRAWDRPTCWSWSISPRAGRQLELTWEHRDRPFLGAHSTTWTLVVDQWQTPFWNPPSSFSLRMNCAPAH